jgi:D-alanyl-D-alanine dipeptidase
MRRPSSASASAAVSAAAVKGQRDVGRVLDFIQVEATQADAANVLVNSGILPDLLALLRTTAVESLREKCAVLFFCV